MDGFKYVLFTMHTITIWLMVFALLRWNFDYMADNRWNRDVRKPSLLAMWLSAVAMIISWAQLWFVIGRV